MPHIESKLNPRSDDFKANVAAMQAIVDDLRDKVEKIAAGGGEARSAFEEDAVFPTGGTAGDMSRRSRFAWALSGSGHYLVECIELALRLPAIDLFLSAAAEEVLPLYDYRIAALRERGHQIVVEDPLQDYNFGGAQVIYRLPEGHYVAATESRKDGQALVS